MDFDNLWFLRALGTKILFPGWRWDSCYIISSRLEYQEAHNVCMCMYIYKHICMPIPEDSNWSPFDSVSKYWCLMFWLHFPIEIPWFTQANDTRYLGTLRKKYYIHDVLFWGDWDVIITYDDLHLLRVDNNADCVFHFCVNIVSWQAAYLLITHHMTTGNYGIPPWSEKWYWKSSISQIKDRIMLNL